MMSFPCILATSSYREIAYDRDPPDSRDSAIYKSHHYYTSEQKLLRVEKIDKPDFITIPQCTAKYSITRLRGGMCGRHRR
jgi:hypothetical protein